MAHRSALVAGRWWRWEGVRAERYRRNADAQTPPIMASRTEPEAAPTPLRSTHTDCEQCGELFQQVCDESVCSECAPQCGDRRPCDICSELFVCSPAQPDMCSNCLSAGPPPEREVDVRGCVGPEMAVVQASEEEVEVYAHGWVDYGDVDADPY